MTMRQKAVWMAVLMLSPWVGHAEENSRWQNYLRSVNSLYEAFEYEQALKQLERAQRFAQTMEDDVTLSLYEGIILADMSRWEASAAAFKAALLLQIDASLPLKVSPKVEAYFEKVRKDVSRELASTAVKKSSQPPKKAPDAQKLPALSAETLMPKVESSQKVSSGEASVAPSSAKEVHPSLPAETAGRDWRRAQVLVPAISGGVLLLAGGTSWGLSRKELSALREGDASLATRAEAHRSANRGSTYQSVGVGLLGAGLVGLGVAAGLYLWTPEDKAKLGLFSNGRSAFVQGRWP
ncbi:hypothetical protein POL68_18030 [Stigmatella sp. ncwal1]|uniref:Tetratricopeptide repeat domain protein n=1 Tax=Stigmatella ashevillensis TaxID=2995309 RepID=A0ABT5D9R3_9BACT|nr:hypothetical protein [Stigmatella ashevillena]MDC0710381.1 hypothetical protein [Stigmatella ashevillena]